MVGFATFRECQGYETTLEASIHGFCVQMRSKMAQEEE
jgi:hypothetical protein